MRTLSLIDQAEALLGTGREWELAKYAIVSWIDEMLLEAGWGGRDWWANNVLEVEIFGTRLCNEQFFLKAREAAALPRRDALEVYYNCVILGFRGLYRDPESAVLFTRAHGLPDDLPTWTRQAALAIRVGQGRPALAGPQRELSGAPPLRSKPRVAWACLAFVILVASNVIAYKLVFGS
jgi:type VI secretion system protein ImpK